MFRLPRAAASFACAVLAALPLHAAEAPLERLTFDAAVARATTRNPSVAQASQAILRAQALLDESKGIHHPNVNGRIATTILDDARGFNNLVTQPKTQSFFGASVSYRFFAPARWAQKNQAADQVAIARIGAEETRRQVGVAAAQAYLAVVAAQRQVEIALRTRETAQALADYARARLEGGLGSRLNDLRARQELATARSLVELVQLALYRAQEALGVVTFADGPIDADGDAVLEAVAPPADEDWLTLRPDIRFLNARLGAAERLVDDVWKSWVPTGTASFSPEYVTPAGVFQPSKSWRAVFELSIPIYDGTRGATRRLRTAFRDSARTELEAASHEARSELRQAQDAVARTERLAADAREAAAAASEALAITEVAYKAGATTNIEVVQAQQTARNAELVAAQAEDRLRQARLDLLVALGRFPR